MIIIITEENDKVSDNVIEWLICFKKKHKRLNYESTIPNLSIQIHSQTDCDLNIELNSASSIWHRRARLNFLPTTIANSPVNSILYNDQKIVNHFVEQYLRDKTRYIGSYIQEVENNKLNDLYAAKSVGLSIPDSLITNNKLELIKFHKKHPKVICKQLSAGYNNQSIDEKYTSSGTELLSSNQIDKLPDAFGISLFQEYIAKEIEIRVFFFEDKYFSMAIFSQNNSQTQTDYRNYDKDNPNRYIPFNLPEDIRMKLNAFNRVTHHSTGSFDLILTPEGQYVFLEINPSGQFHWLSQNCNYYIEKDIADYL